MMPAPMRPSPYRSLLRRNPDFATLYAAQLTRFAGDVCRFRLRTGGLVRCGEYPPRRGRTGPLRGVTATPAAVPGCGCIGGGSGGQALAVTPTSAIADRARRVALAIAVSTLLAGALADVVEARLAVWVMAALILAAGSAWIAFACPILSRRRATLGNR